MLYELPATVSLLHPLFPKGTVYRSLGYKCILKRCAGRVPNPDGRRTSNGERPTRTPTRVLPPTNLRSARWSALPSTLMNRITELTVYHPPRNDRIDKVLWLEIPRLLFTARCPGIQQGVARQTRVQDEGPWSNFAPFEQSGKLTNRLS